MLTMQIEQPWEPAVRDFGRYAPTRPNGKRVAGWEDVNITALAADVGVSFRYLLAVLSGQRNCTLALLQQTAVTLGIPLTELITRMEQAFHLRSVAQTQKVPKSEQRRIRSERRALATM